MRRCPNCTGRGVYSDGGRVVCLLCGHVVHDPEPTLIDKILSNATPEAAGSPDGERFGPRVPADLAAIKARVLSRIRSEAARA